MCAHGLYNNLCAEMSRNVCLKDQAGKDSVASKRTYTAHGIDTVRTLHRYGADTGRAFRLCQTGHRVKRFITTTRKPLQFFFAGWHLR